MAVRVATLIKEYFAIVEDMVQGFFIFTVSAFVADSFFPSGKIDSVVQWVA